VAPGLTYTLLAALAALFIFAFWVDGRPDTSRWHRFRKFTLIVQLSAIAGAYVLLRPGTGHDTSLVGSHAAAGRVVLLDLYSNW
jgi:hypothetical protein